MVDRITSPEPTPGPARTPRTTAVANAPAETGKIGTDELAVQAHGAAKDPLHDYPVGHEDDHADDTSPIEDIAHKAHNPHGALHAVEAGEAAVKVGGRVFSRASRVAAAAAEVTHHPGQGHHGLMGKVEHAVEGAFAKVGKFLGGGIRRIPGGAKFLEVADRAIGAPGRWLGPGVDKALVGTRLGGAVKMTGAGSRFLHSIGGRIPFIGAVLGGVIAVADYRSSAKILRDPTASTKEKVIAGAQGGLSIASGVAGVGALGVAAAVAVGFTAPVSVPLLLGVAAVTGIASFALSFFKKSTH